MSTLMNLIDLTRGALQADQTALNATANNVANQNTVGYADEVVNWTEGDTVTLSGQAQLPEAPTATTTSLRDRVLDQRVQQQTQTQSSTAAEAAVLSQMEGVFSITGDSTTAGSTQIGTALNAFFSSLTALAANPSDEPTQEGVLSAAQTLAQAFNAAATGLAGVNRNVNSGLAASVTQVNSLTKSIATLNGQIEVNDPNQDAGQLEDMRQLDITKLSALIGLNQTTTESNGILLTTTGGTVLVAGQQSYALSTAQVGSNTQLYDDTGTNITAGVSGGSIGGQLTAQGVDLPVASNALDQLAYQIGTAVNTQNEAGQTSAGVAGAAIFTVPLSQANAAAEMSVIPTDPGAIATAAVGNGSTDNTNANALANLQAIPGGAGGTMIENLAALLSDVGSTSATLQNENTTQQGSLTQLTTQQDTQSGVNLDTEASNLTVYQRSYQAASQVFTIVDQLMASAINMGTEAAVS
jgi:flagellar hook-associated protein 1 FlgK